MHATAITNADLFFKTYVQSTANGLKLVEIGSQDINGSLRQLCPQGAQYVGVDFTRRMLHAKKDFFNGRLRRQPELLRHRGETEDLMKLNFLAAMAGIKAPRSRHRLAKFLLSLWR